MWRCYIRIMRSDMSLEFGGSVRMSGQAGCGKTSVQKSQTWEIEDDRATQAAALDEGCGKPGRGPPGIFKPGW